MRITKNFRALISVLTVVSSLLLPLSARASSGSPYCTNTNVCTSSNQAPGYTPSDLISDSVFTAYGMSTADVQAFLTKQGSWLANYTIPAAQDVPYCYTDSSGNIQTNGLYSQVPQQDDTLKPVDQFGGISAAQLIADQSHKYGINPEVLLVTIQKESSAILKSQIPNPWTLAWLLGFSYNGNMAVCSYSQAQASKDAHDYGGVGQQIAYAAHYALSKLYNTPFATCTAPMASIQWGDGDASAASIIPNGCGTYSLYKYTPYVYVGNYNFWYYIHWWFWLTATSGAEVVKGSGPTIYYYEPTPTPHLMYVQTFAALSAWGINMPYSVVDDTQLSSLPVVGTVSQVVTTDNGYAYLINNDTKYHISSPGLTGVLGLSWSQLSYVPQAELANMPEGTPMGFLTGSNGSPDLYLPSNNEKFYFPDASTVFDWGFSFNTIQWNDPSFLGGIATYPNPLQVFYRVQGSPNMYAVSGGKSLYIPNPTVAYAWGFDPGNASQVGAEIPYLLPAGPTLTQVAMDSSNGNVYYLSGGQKHYVSSFSKLAAVGQSKNNLISVSTNLLAKVPTGSAL